MGKFDSENGIVAPLLLAPLSSAVKALCEASSQVSQVLHDLTKFLKWASEVDPLSFRVSNVV